MKRQGGRVLGISTEPLERLKDQRASRPTLPVELASDPDAAAIKTLKLLHNFAGQTISLPTTIVVDRAGVIRWVHYAELMTDRPDPVEVLAKVKALSEK